MATPHQTNDLDSLLHTSRALKRHEYRTDWYLTALAIPCTLSVITILGYITKSYWYKLIPHCLDRRNASNQRPVEAYPAQTASNNDNEADTSNITTEGSSISFASYPLQHRAWDKLHTVTCKETACRASKKRNLSRFNHRSWFTPDAV